MPASVPPTQWPLRPDARASRRDLSEEFLGLERVPGQGKITGLSSAVADWLGVDVLLVRTVFAMTTLSSGLGLFLYVAGWLLTSDAKTGRAPLDRLGTGWQRYPGRNIVGTALAACLVATLTISGWLGMAWLAPVVLGITAWLGWRSRHGLMKPAKPPVIRPAASRANRPGQRRTTLPMAVLTLSVAVLVGGLVYDVLGAGPWPVIASMLLVVGAGLIVTAWSGRSILLIVAGTVLSLALAATMAYGPSPIREHVVYTEQAALHDLNLTGSRVILDLSALDVTSDSTWTVNAGQSSVVIQLPHHSNAEVTVDYVDSLVGVGPDIMAGQGQLVHAFMPNPDGPMVHIVLNVHSSELWVEATP